MYRLFYFCRLLLCLSKQLDLAEGDQVEFVRLGHLLALCKLHHVSQPHSLRHLAGVVKSSRPKASVDVVQYCKKFLKT